MFSSPTLLNLTLLYLCFFVVKTTGQNQGPSCFEEGECTRSLYIDDWLTPDAQGCLEQCRKDASCQFFTFYQDEGSCVGFSNCEDFQTDTCIGCYSGEGTCADLQCWTHGQCSGQLIHSLNAETANDCLDACKLEDSCQWFTHNDKDNTCLLLEDCGAFDASCVSCISGQRSCQRRYTKLMVFSGHHVLNYIDQVELIDLENPQNSCVLASPYPNPGQAPTSDIVGGVLKSCGDSVNTHDECHDFDPATNSWTGAPSLLQGRRYAQSSYIDGLWLVTGDGKTTELWDGDQFVEGPLAPYAFLCSCQLTINSTHLFFVDSSGPAYILNWETGASIELDSHGLEDPGYLYLSCGLIKNPQRGKEIVVVGHGQSQIFNLDSLAWRGGPAFPNGNEEMGSAQWYNTFILVGGANMYEGALPQDTIYIFDEVNYEWVLLEKRLQFTRSDYPGVVPVPDDFATCP